MFNPSPRKATPAGALGRAAPKIRVAVRREAKQTVERGVNKEVNEGAS
jgi:hypothetical protein